MHTMTDHPGWQRADGRWRRLFVSDDGRSWLVVLPDRDAVRRPGVATYALSAGVAEDQPELAAALTALSPVTRYATASLWDAIVAAIIRQVVRASQATLMYRAFCAAYGATHCHDGMAESGVPTADVVAELSDDQFARTGMSFKRHALRAAARAYLDQGSGWSAATPTDLVGQLQTVPRIGPWTAGAAVADWTNDFALYPYDDLAVRTWAGRAAPQHRWPDDNAGFAREWRRLGGAHLGSLTALTLALGRNHGPHDT
jgi:DNA-3-methyladenine glycosylase II